MKQVCSASKHNTIIAWKSYGLGLHEGNDPTLDGDAIRHYCRIWGAEKSALSQRRSFALIEAPADIPRGLCGLQTGAYYTWKGSVLESTPIEPDQVVEFDWRQRRLGRDFQLERAVAQLETDLLSNQAI
jgi:hypothetical protein